MCSHAHLCIVLQIAPFKCSKNTIYPGEDVIKSAVGYFKVLSQHFPGQTDDDFEETKSPGLQI